MAVTKDNVYEDEYNCLVSDLVSSFPPSTTGYEEGSIMYALDGSTKKLTKIFKLINGVWYLFYEV